MPINNINSVTPPFLKKDDVVEIIASSKFVSKNDIGLAIQSIEEAGFNVKINSTLFNKLDVFSGSIQNRIAVLQEALDSRTSQALLFARGGYGFIHLIDYIDFSTFIKTPKWIVGFSDMTILLTHLQLNYQIKSIHGPMAYNFLNTDTHSRKQLFSLLTGNLEELKFDSVSFNKCGVSEGVVLGGNLSILSSLVGSSSLSSNLDQYILFIEDLDEYLYHIERMMYTLDRAGVLKNLKGLIVGHMTNILDNEIPFGKTVYELIYDVAKKYNYPICFNFPAGHDLQNIPFIIGAKIQMDINSHCSRIKYIK
ncbi:MAG: LD-carboxypeptidase [Flavobacteriales bacterium]|nr:LD-carboxypeptidase [Flavobacteriales bacterium]|tara:strand:+ start:638 stop:1564 length:927 start_codon:yes stop_codon:yes gene_type:complete